MSWKLLDTDNCRVLSVRDVQLFIKRLRSNIKYTYEKETNKKIHLLFGITLSVNMEKPHFDHTTMESCGSIPDGLLTTSMSYSLKHGKNELELVLPPLDERTGHLLRSPLLHMLRNILIALIICQKCLPQLKYARSQSAVGDRLSEACFNLTRKFSRYSIKGLLQLAFPRKMEDRLLLLRFYPHLRIDCSRSVYAIVCSLLMLELESIDLLNDSLRQRISKVTKNGLTTLKEK